MDCQDNKTCNLFYGDIYVHCLLKITTFPLKYDLIYKYYDFFLVKF